MKTKVVKATLYVEYTPLAEMTADEAFALLMNSTLATYKMELKGLQVEDLAIETTDEEGNVTELLT